MKIFKYIFFISVTLIIPEKVLVQQFSPEILIAPDQLNSFPSIDIDSNGDIGIIWGVDGNPDDTIKFVKSYDSGASFDSTKIVDILPYHPDSGYPITPLLLFDSSNNPMVFYVRWYFPYSYYHYYKKSNDGGVTFPTQRFSFLSRNNLVDYIFLSTDTTLLGYSYYPTQNVMVKRSINAGQSYNDSTLLFTGGSSPQRNISFARCGKTNVLCSYTQYNTSDSKINYNRSEDMGLTFSSNIQLDSAFQYHNGGIMKSFQNYVFMISFADGDTITPKIVFYKSDDFGHTFNTKKVIFDYGNVNLNTYAEPTIVFNINVGICLLWNEYRGLQDKTWFSYSDDFGENFSQPVVVTEGHQWVTDKAMAVSDSGDVYITYLNDTNQNIVLRKTKLPILTEISRYDYPVPPEFAILNNYPNPFNSSTQITFKLSKKAKTSLEIYDVSGKRIIQLMDSVLTYGEHKVTWNGLDSNGVSCASGIYICMLKSGSTLQSTKMLLIK